MTLPGRVFGSIMYQLERGAKAVAWWMCGWNLRFLCCKQHTARLQRESRSPSAPAAARQPAPAQPTPTKKDGTAGTEGAQQDDDGQHMSFAVAIRSVAALTRTGRWFMPPTEVGGTVVLRHRVTAPADSVQLVERDTSPRHGTPASRAAQARRLGEGSGATPSSRRRRKYNMVNESVHDLVQRLEAEACATADEVAVEGPSATVGVHVGVGKVDDHLRAPSSADGRDHLASPQRFQRSPGMVPSPTPVPATTPGAEHAAAPRNARLVMLPPICHPPQVHSDADATDGGQHDGKIERPSWSAHRAHRLDPLKR